MKAEIRDSWADALESGQYEQGRASLRQGKAFCCLGVLCELYRKSVRKGRWEQNRDTGEAMFEAGSDAQIAYLPESVRKWAGLKDANPRLGTGAHDFAADLNDDGTPFSEIARLVRQLPGE